MEALSISNNANDEYWYFDKEVDKETCDKIIGLAKDWQSAQVHANLNDEVKNNPYERITDVTWCNRKMGI